MKKLLLAYFCFILFCAAANTSNLVAQDLAVQIEGGFLVCPNSCTEMVAVPLPLIGIGPYFYTWNTGGTSQVEIACQPGLYSVTVSDATGATGSAQVIISPPQPSVFLQTTPADCGACNGSVMILGSLTGFTATWLNGANGTQLPDGMVDACPGVYTVMVTELAGGSSCTQTLTAVIESAPIDLPAQDATCGLCNGSVLLPTDSLSGEYLIIGSSGTTNTIFSPVPLVEGLCPGNYTYMPNNSTNCLTNFVIGNIDLDLEADASFSSSAGTVPNLQACADEAVQFWVNSSDNTLLSWDFGDPSSGDANTSNLSNPSHVYSATGNYTVTLIVQACQDADTVQATIQVDLGSAPNIECPSLVCPGETETYNTDVVCDNYVWTVVGGTIVSGQSTAEISVIWDDAPSGSVNLQVSDCAGGALCTPSTTVIIPVLSNNIPISGEPIVCAGSIENYSIVLFGGVQYQWAITPASAGTIVAGQGTNQASVQWNNQDGTLIVQMHSSLLECTAQNDLPVQVNTPYSISGPDVVCEGASAVYTASVGLHNWTVTGSASISSGGSNSNSVTVVADTGSGAFATFSVEATPVDNSSFCDFPQSLTATVAEIPTAPLLSGETLICPQNAYLYEVAAPSSALTYHWTVTGGTPASFTGSNLSILWGNGGNYNISVVARSITAPFCESLAGTFTATAVSNLTLSGNDVVCAGEKLSYSAAPFLPDMNYQWSVSPAEAGSVVNGQGSTNAVVQWNNGVANATLTVAICGLSAQLNVDVHQAATPTITQSANLCAGGSTILSVIPNNYANYIWSNAANGNDIGVGAGGSYVVTVTDAFNCTATQVLNVHQYPLPTASIDIADYPYSCTTDPVNLPVEALVGNGYNYNWTVNGAPVGSNSPSVTHVSNNVLANFQYIATVTDANGCSAVSNPAVVFQIDCFPSVCGGGDPAPGDGPSCLLPPNSFIGIAADPGYCNTVTFQNLSTGLNYVWDFGDGTVISVPDNSPQTHTYAEPGYYTIRIYGEFTNLNGVPATCSYSSHEVIEVPLVADFDFLQPCLNSPTEFTDRSLHTAGTSISNWTWDFGDGTTSNDTDPSHQYTAAGTYIVTLTVEANVCTQTISKSVTINPLPDASFSTSSPICEGTSTSFSPVNNPSAIIWQWDFGDGSTLVANNGEHTYIGDGNYSASLTVTDNLSCVGSASQNIAVLDVQNGDISAPSLTACAGETITLTAPAGASFTWSDASNASTLVASQTGQYSVTVTQANACTYTAPTVSLNFAPLPPAQISPNNSPIIVCPGATASFSAEVGSGYAYSWSTGQNSSEISLLYNGIADAGTVLSVTVSDPATGCSNVSNSVTVQKALVTPPFISPFGNVNLCEWQTTTLTASHPTLNNFTWSTGVLGSAINVSSEGVYSVFVTDANGCVASAEKSVTVNAGMNMALIPVGCYDYCQDSTLTVPDNFMGYQWLLNGVPVAGANSNVLDPQVDGDYQLQVTSMWGCQDTSDYLSLTLVDCAPCDVTSSFTNSNTCTTLNVVATSTGNGVLSYTWDWGDGSTNSGATSQHVYATGGNYDVCLITLNTAADGDTCSASFCQTVNLTISDLSVIFESVVHPSCGTNTGSIDAGAVGGAAPYTYAWSNSGVASDLQNGLSAGNYSISITDGLGCMAVENTTLVGILDSPVLVCGTATDNSVVFEWAAIASASGYEIVIDGAAPETLPSSQLSYEVSGLSPVQTVNVSLVALGGNGCSDSASSAFSCTTTVAPCPPTNAISILGLESNYCLNANSLALSDYFLPLGGTFTGAALQGDVFAPATAGIGTHTVNYSVTTNVGGSLCAFDSSLVLTVLPLPIPTVSVPPLSCMGDTTIITYTSDPNNILAYTWDFGTTPFVDNGNGSIQVAWQTDGTHNFSTNVNDAWGCTADAQFSTVVSGIQLSINASLTTVMEGESSTITALVNGAAAGDTLLFVWSNGNQSVTCSSPPDNCAEFTVSPNDTTIYTLTVSDPNGCDATASVTINVEPRKNRVILPNAFTPNDDSQNNIFRLVGYGVAEYQMRIFNRWGALVYDGGLASDLSMGWNGIERGDNAEIGVYSYTVWVRFNDGKEDMLRGNVTLVR